MVKFVAEKMSVVEKVSATIQFHIVTNYIGVFKASRSHQLAVNLDRDVILETITLPFD